MFNLLTSNQGKKLIISVKSKDTFSTHCCQEKGSGKLIIAHYQYIWNDRTVTGWVWCRYGSEIGWSFTRMPDTSVLFQTCFRKCFRKCFWRDFVPVTSSSEIQSIFWVFRVVSWSSLPDIPRGTEIGGIETATLILECSALLRYYSFFL